MALAQLVRAETLGAVAVPEALGFQTISAGNPGPVLKSDWFAALDLPDCLEL
jgi:hypothetical protein